MRHKKYRHSLGVKKEHREAIVAAMASALFKHQRIETTLARAKALRPFAERLITLAKKASQSSDGAQKLHYRRQADARLRNPSAVQALFDERASEFLNRAGGYTRIYKLGPRGTDASPMALMELIPASDEGYKKSKRKGKGKGKAKKSANASAPAAAKPEAVPAASAAADAPAADTEVKT